MKYLPLLLLLTSCASHIDEPLNMVDEAKFAQQELQDYLASAEPVVKPITLYEAMARALKYNLDDLVERRETEYLMLRQDLAKTGIWPTLTAALGFSNRNNEAGSRSRSLLSGNESLEPSTSTDKDYITGDLTLSWNLIDVALGLVGSDESKIQLEIARENRRKVINRIIEDVRTAYWRTISAERSYRKLLELEALAQEALQRAYTLEQTKKVALLPILTYQLELLKIQSQVQKIQRELLLAKYQLAALMDLPPSTKYRLEIPERSSIVPLLPGSVKRMVRTALYYRSELRELLYQKKLNHAQLDRAFLESLPTFNLMFGTNYNSNSYLYNDQWYGFSSQVSWDLLSVFKYPLRKKTIIAEEKVIDARKKALVMAVMTQVHVARARFIRVSQELNTIKQTYDVQSRVLDLTEAGYKSSLVSEQKLVKEKMNYILTEINYDSAYSEMQNAYANIFASMGLDNYEFNFNDQTSIYSLAEDLETFWTERALVLRQIR
ncbi:MULTISPECIES: TolC family protein [unclassified Vibrio]|uniref:TolC family protein n=1 Tax=Vibrio sp. HB236076 TaxID=3232307 RepID=A0AB39HIS7_9VIBR|nr:TolC family protein [Vibrio sp. HB161653]MDP5255141.1 TolC family protein [Vibrio sp. HB161653]